MIIEYVLERYDVFHHLFIGGWVIWCAGTYYLGATLYELDEDDPYKGQKRYYGIILIVSLFLIGAVGTLLLPSVQLVEKWLS